MKNKIKDFEKTLEEMDAPEREIFLKEMVFLLMEKLDKVIEKESEIIAILTE